jgi:glycolate oxidase FAD binding subunit
MTTATPSSITLTNPGDIADLVRHSAARKVPIADYGVAHHGVGNPPPREHVNLSLTGGVIEHYERDLTVRAHAGVTLGSLREALKPSGQFVPIDAEDELTLGEVINHHVYGGLRAAYGSIRDLLLGLRYIDAEGRDIHVGGRTVKNVAGLDVTRLMVGSLGELGVIHEATLRTYAIPEQSAFVAVRVEDPAALDALLPSWVTGNAAPAWLLLDNIGGWTARVGYVGRSIATTAQERSLAKLLSGVSGVQILGSNSGPLEQSMQDLASQRAWRARASALAKVVVPSVQTGVVCSRLAKNGPSVKVAAAPVHGCIFVGGELDAAATRSLDSAIDGAVGEAGFRVWHERPAGCEDLAPFAPLPTDLPMMKRLKQAMDPKYLFNRGRLIPVADGVAS